VPDNSAKNSIVTLQEVQNYFYDRGIREISAEKMTELYCLIDDHAYLCVRNPDQMWMPCGEDDDERMACNEIVDILELDHSIIDEYYMIVASTIDDVCEQFGEMTQKDKIPFYISVLDRLLPDA